MNTDRNQQQPQRAVMTEPSRVEFIRNLSAIQNNLKVGKDHKNDYGGYPYRNASDILETVKPVLSEFGYDLVINSEIVEISGRFYVKTTVSVTDGINEKSVSAMARETENRKGMDDSQVTGSATTYSKKYALENLFCIDNNQDADSWDNSHNPGYKPRQQPNRQHYQNNRNQQVHQQNNQPYQNNPQPQQQPQNTGYQFQQPTGHQPQQANTQVRAVAPVITPAQVQKLRNGMRMADVTEERFCKAAQIDHIGQLTKDRVKQSVEWLKAKAMQ